MSLNIYKFNFCPPKEFFRYINSKHIREGKVRFCYMRGLISEFYGIIKSGSQDSSLHKVEAWRKDLKEDLSMNDGMEACGEAQTQTVS